jgi:hypothetical protein
VRGNWWFAGPFRGGLDAADPPEAQPSEIDAAAPPPSAAWRFHPDDGPSFVFHSRFEWAEHVTGYARTAIYSVEDCTVTLSIGSDDGVRVWLNGKQVFEHEGFLLQGAGCARVTLRKGWNRLLAKVANQTRHHALDLKILDD